MEADAPIEHDIGWPVVSLAEIATKIGSGATPRGGSDTYLPSRARFALVRSQNVFDRRFDHDGLAFISDEQADRLRGVILEPGDLLLNITGDGITFGRACAVPNDVLPACVNQHVSIIRVDAQRADAGYVLSFLTHPKIKSYIESFNAGGSRRAITKGHIESFRLPLPPLPVQRAIARILGTLDDKIELNRLMNETLETMARALFKSWFVEPQASLPKGWREGLIGDLCEIAIGGDWGEDKEFEGSAETICLRGVDLEHLRATGQANAPRRWVRVGSLSQRRLDERDVLVAASGAGPTGRPLWAFSELERSFGLPVTYSNFCKRLRCQSPAAAIYVDRLLHIMHESGEIWEYVNGTSIPNLDARSLLHRKEIMIPTSELLERFYQFYQPIARRLYSGESRSLTEMREALLPKLLSGELRLMSGSPQSF